MLWMGKHETLGLGVGKPGAKEGRIPSPLWGHGYVCACVSWNPPPCMCWENCRVTEC